MASAVEAADAPGRLMLLEHLGVYMYTYIYIHIHIYSYGQLGVNICIYTYICIPI